MNILQKIFYKIILALVVFCNFTLPQNQTQTISKQNQIEQGQEIKMKKVI